MPGRSYSGNGYRYGYNGKEKDDEVKNASGTQYDYGFRIYDPRLGKFLSVDPLSYSYPMLTPYQFASNTPIQAIDLDGLEAKKQTTINSDGTTTIKVSLSVNIIDGTTRTFTRTTNRQTLEESYQVSSYGKGTLSNAQMQQYAKEYKEAIPQYYNGYDEKNKIHYEYEVTNVSIIPPDQYQDGGGGLNIVVVPDNKVFDAEAGGYKTTTVGMVDKIGDTQNNAMQITLGSDGGTKAHETGHWMGLEHVTPNYQTGQNADRLMRDGAVIKPANAPEGNIVTNGERAKTTKNVPEKGSGGGGGGKFGSYPVKDL